MFRLLLVSIKSWQKLFEYFANQYAYETYENTLKSIEKNKEIEGFCNGKECQLILDKIQNEVDKGKMFVILYKTNFGWNYDMIEKCFTKYGYVVKKNCLEEIIIKWGGG